MKERSNQPQNPPAGNEPPEIYSVSQDKDGSFHFTRRGFLTFGAAIGGTLLLRGVCPRFGANSAPSEPVQAGMMPLPRVTIHTSPSITSNIAGTLQQHDLVRLISDHPDLGWVEVAAQSGQQGWVKRSFVDFSRAIKSSSRNFDLSSTLTQPNTQTNPPQTFSVELHSGDDNSEKVTAAGQAQVCGEVIQNGDFESGQVSWVEVSTGDIIRNDWLDPYQGSYVAWFGGLVAVERLTQLFHVPPDVEDDQRLDFYLKVDFEGTANEGVATFYLRFLDAVGDSLLDEDIKIADNVTKTDWLYFYVDLNGMTELADQDIQIQFKADFNVTNITHFVIDAVSLNLICEVIPPTPTQTPTPTATPTQTEEPPPVYYVYLPVVVRATLPDPTATSTSTPRPSATPCPSHCASDCSSHCSSDCPSDCFSYCGFDCGWDCPSDCYSICSFYW